MHRVKPQIPDEEYHRKLFSRSQTFEGKEIPSDVPMAPPIGYVKQPSMVEHIRAMVQSEMVRQRAMASGLETFEEADDFDVADDLEPLSGFENDEQFEPKVPVEESPPVEVKESTGVPLPPGEGEGARGEPPQPSPQPAQEAQEPVKRTPEPPKAPPAKPRSGRV